MKLDVSLRTRLDRYLARLWIEEEQLVKQLKRPLTKAYRNGMSSYYLERRKGKPGAAKFAVRWLTIQQTKKRINGYYIALKRKHQALPDYAPFADSQSVVEFEKAVKEAQNGAESCSVSH